MYYLREFSKSSSHSLIQSVNLNNLLQSQDFKQVFFKTPTVYLMYLPEKNTKHN